MFSPINPNNDFERLILNEFLEGDRIVRTLRKYQFESDLENSFRAIVELIEQSKYDQIPNLVGAVLVTINDRLRRIDDKEDKLILEQLSKELFIDSVRLLKQTEEGRKCLSHSTEGLKKICEIKRYDFIELNRILELDHFHVVRIQSKNKFPYYDWQSGNVNELNELAKDLQDKQIINGVINFKRLFNPINNLEFRFKAHKEKVDHLLVLFQILKEKKLIKPKVLSGHFIPLSQYGRDNENILFEKKPNKLMEKLKRDKALHTKIHHEMEQCIRYNCKQSLAIVERQ